MTNTEIIEQLQVIFRDILDNEEIVLKNITAARDVEEWDSLAQIQLIVEIEKHFSIKFTSKEIFEWKNIGEMIDNILTKL